MSRVTALTPRLLTKADAAHYCGYGVTRFTELVAKGIFPDSVPDTTRWDRKALDAALDEKSGLCTHSPPSALDQWRRKRNARAS